MIHISTTVEDLNTARHLAQAALDAHLAACVNVTPNVLSLFRWEGRIEEETELTVTFKTTEERRQALIALIAEHHPYDLPVVTWENVGTTPEVERWCYEATNGGGQPSS